MASKRFFLFLCVCTGNLLAISVGFSIVWSSSAIPKLTSNSTSENPIGRPIDYNEVGWIGSFFPLGAMVGSILSSILSVYLGKKHTAIYMGGVPCCLGFLGLAYANKIEYFYVCRFVIGIASGAIYTVVPQYNGEVAETDVRGLICALLTSFETFGELMGFILGPILSIYWFSMIIFGTTLFATIAILVIVPKNPSFLVAQNDLMGAQQSLMRLRSVQHARDVMEELRTLQQIHDEDKIQEGKFSDIFFVKPLRKAQLMTIGLLIFQQTTGLLAVIFYAQSIFMESGSEISPHVCVIAMGVVEFLTSFITPHTIDKLGRKPLLCISATGMAIGQISLGMYFYFKNEGRDMDAYSWLPVTCLMLFIHSYYMGFGPVPFTMMTEVFPTNMKTFAYMISILVLWISALFMSKYFYVVAELLGTAYCFWFFGGMAITAIFFTIFFVIETKGKSFTEIQEMLQR